MKPHIQFNLHSGPDLTSLKPDLLKLSVLRDSLKQDFSALLDEATGEYTVLVRDTRNVHAEAKSYFTKF